MRVKSITWDHGGLFLVDQTKLPVEVVAEEQTSVEQVWVTGLITDRGMVHAPLHRNLSEVFDG
jgi:methylthioribose-1-phosphate isomerase